MQNSKNAFTMIELIFVIVVLGILASVAIPHFAGTRTDAHIAKGRADVASIRSAIVTERQARLIQGVSGFAPNGTGTYVATNGTTYNQMDNGGLFGGVLTYAIPNTAGVDGKWSAAAGSGTYQYRLKAANNTFDYNATTGRFTCTGGAYCSKLAN